MKYAPRKVYIKESGGYVELSYTDFCRRRNADQTYMDKLFIPVQGCLLEVVREQYTDFYRDKERWRYLQKLDAKNSLLGDCGITIQNIDGEKLPEIGYHIHKKYWRCGLAKEAAQAVRDWAFENTEYASLYSYCKYTNEASYKTAEAIGMHFDKEYPDEVNKITRVSVIHRTATRKHLVSVSKAMAQGKLHRRS